MARLVAEGVVGAHGAQVVVVAHLYLVLALVGPPWLVVAVQAPGAAVGPVLVVPKVAVVNELPGPGWNWRDDAQ